MKVTWFLVLWNKEAVRTLSHANIHIL